MATQFQQMTGQQILQQMAKVAAQGTTGPIVVNEKNQRAALDLALLSLRTDWYCVRRDGRVTRISFPQPVWERTLACAPSASVNPK